MARSLSKEEIIGLLERLNDELRQEDVNAELLLVGGAVMCLVYEARQTTRDLDGYFQPTRLVREAAARVAATADLDPRWLNDGVKGLLGDRPSFVDYRQFSNLKVSVAKPEFMLAMKCMAMRIGEEFQDQEDVRYLIRHLDLRTYDEAVDLIARFYPLDRFPQKTLYALEELFEELGRAR